MIISWPCNYLMWVRFISRKFLVRWWSFLDDYVSAVNASALFLDFLWAFVYHEKGFVNILLMNMRERYWLVVMSFSINVNHYRISCVTRDLPGFYTWESVPYINCFTQSLQALCIFITMKSRLVACKSISPWGSCDCWHFWSPCEWEIGTFPAEFALRDIGIFFNPTCRRFELTFVPISRVRETKASIVVSHFRIEKMLLLLFEELCDCRCRVD